MKSAFDNFSEIKIKIRKARGTFLLFDFDGVLSAIAPTPDDAFLSSKNRDLLKKCAKLYKTAIISGRGLKDIKKKVGLNNILYIASHGLEWEERGKYKVKPIPKRITEAIDLARRKIRPILSRYPGIVFEDKPFTIVVHFRRVNSKLIVRLKKEIMEIVRPIMRGNSLRLDVYSTSFELRPQIGWDKGDSALFAEKYFRKETGKKLASIYIGDSLTDEDAFKALKNGITIRVRTKKGSAAKYYLKSRTEVDKFLEWLLKLKS